MTTATLVTDANTVRHWLLGNRQTDDQLRALSRRYGWSWDRYSKAFERALRLELIEYDRQLHTWGASRSRLCGEVAS